jgi:hypothetical protein
MTVPLANGQTRVRVCKRGGFFLKKEKKLICFVVLVKGLPKLWFKDVDTKEPSLDKLATLFAAFGPVAEVDVLSDKSSGCNSFFWHSNA